MKAEQLAQTSKDLMLREPFYGLFLIMLNKRWNSAIPTACVSLRDINYQLDLNEDFWETLTPKQRGGLLKHELLHIGFFHLTDFSHLKDQELANIAMDCEINQYIAIDDLPPGGILPSLFPELNLELKKGTNYYYEKLSRAKKNKGSCPNLDAILDGMAAGEMTVMVDANGQPTKVQLPDHSGWKDISSLPEATQKLIKKQTEYVLKEVAEQVNKSRGTIPGEFVQILAAIDVLEEPKFDWRGYLRRFSGGSTKVYTKKTRRKFNKRYQENPGMKIKPKRHILFAIDTSGSVSTEELNECFQELHHIHKTGTEISVLQADTVLHLPVEKFNPHKEFEVHGRGGTDFQDVIDFYNENTHKYTCLMYFTDGEAPAPTPARGRMLWVLSSKSPINENLIGPQIKLN